MTFKIDADEMHPGLWQGSRPPRGSAVADNGFDVLVLAAEEIQDSTLYKGVKVILAPGDDTDNLKKIRSQLPTWQSAAIDVAKAVMNGKKVLVTCHAGLNRSGYITALALHHLTGWSGKKCVDHIQSRREFALCNDTFAEQLRMIRGK